MNWDKINIVDKMDFHKETCDMVFIDLIQNSLRVS